MASHEASIEVEVPHTDAFEEWTDYESFPRFMEGVQEVRELGDGRIRWRAELASRPREWEAEVAADPDGGLVTWRSVDGVQWDGDVAVLPAGDDRATVRLRIEYDAEGAVEGARAAATAVRSRVERSLQAFKRYAEERHAARREAEEAASGRSPGPP